MNRNSELGSFMDEFDVLLDGDVPPVRYLDESFHSSGHYEGRDILVVHSHLLLKVISLCLNSEENALKSYLTQITCNCREFQKKQNRTVVLASDLEVSKI